MKQLVWVGLFFIFLGFLFVLAGTLTLFDAGKAKSAGGTKVAVGGFIGPIPFGWANDKRLFYPLIGLLIAMAVFWIVWQMMNR